MDKFLKERKLYAKEAKERLTSTKVNPESDEGYFLNNRRLTVQEVAHMAQIIEEISASDVFVMDPLKTMMDNKEYNALPEPAKMKYILDLSSIFVSMKEKMSK